MSRTQGPYNLNRFGTLTRLTHEHTCVICGRSFTHAQPDVQCCGRKCACEKARRTRLAKKKENAT